MLTVMVDLWADISGHVVERFLYLRVSDLSFYSPENTSWTESKNNICEEPRRS